MNIEISIEYKIILLNYYHKMFLMQQGKMCIKACNNNKMEELKMFPLYLFTLTSFLIMPLKRILLNNKKKKRCGFQKNYNTTKRMEKRKKTLHLLFLPLFVDFSIQRDMKVFP